MQNAFAKCAACDRLFFWESTLDLDGAPNHLQISRSTESSPDLKQLIQVRPFRVKGDSSETEPLQQTFRGKCFIHIKNTPGVRVTVLIWKDQVSPSTPRVVCVPTYEWPDK